MTVQIRSNFVDDHTTNQDHANQTSDIEYLHKSEHEMQHYELSSPQREIWFDQMVHPETPKYNIGGYVEINGSIDVAHFQSAINQLLEYNDELRAVFFSADDQVPQKKIRQHVPVITPYYDFTGENRPRDYAANWMQQNFETPFSLAGEPLFVSVL